MGKIICYIHNNICCNIMNKTFGIDNKKSNRVSLTDFLLNMLCSILIFIALSWWLIPLRCIIHKFSDYSDNKYFTCTVNEGK